jgi:hypothetical protein
MAITVHQVIAFMRLAEGLATLTGPEKKSFVLYQIQSTPGFSELDSIPFLEELIEVLVSVDRKDFDLGVQATKGCLARLCKKIHN